jgi:hypothetical protein
LCKVEERHDSRLLIARRILGNDLLDLDFIFFSEFKRRVAIILRRLNQLGKRIKSTPITTIINKHTIVVFVERIGTDATCTARRAPLATTTLFINDDANIVQPMTSLLWRRLLADRLERFVAASSTTTAPILAASSDVTVQVGAASRRFGLSSSTTSNLTLLAIWQQLEKKEQTRFVAARINDKLDVRRTIP